MRYSSTAKCVVKRTRPRERRARYLGNTRFSAGDNILENIRLFPFMLMIPEIPIIAPFIPSDAEMFHIYPVFREHAANLSSCHAGHAVAIDNNFLVRVCFFQCAK